MRKQQQKRPFLKVYSSVPPDVKEVIRSEAERRGLQMSDVIRELLMEKYGNQTGKSIRSSSQEMQQNAKIGP
jgi:DNA polymerase III delta subunit